MGLSSKLKTLLWFVKRPNMYRQLGFLLYQRLFPHPQEDTRTEATIWCQQRGISSFNAIQILTSNENVLSIEELFPEFMATAKQIVNALPVKMGGEADLELLYYLAEKWQAKTIVETGVAYGWSSSIFLLSLKHTPGGKLFSTDMPYPKMNNESFVGCVVPDELKSNWTLISLPDRQALPKIDKRIKEIDLCHYDSDKSYRGRMWAYKKLWQKIRPGGLFISDDVNDNVAFKDFSDQLGLEPIIVFYEPENKYVGILVKSI